MSEGPYYEDETTGVAGPPRRRPMGGPPVPYWGGGGGGWGYGGGPWMRRPSMPIETKPFFLTSEFFGVLVLIAAMGIGAASSDGFDARMFWILTTAAVSAYVVSRGIAKSGTKSRAFDPREDMQFLRREGHESE